MMKRALIIFISVAFLTGLSIYWFIRIEHSRNDPSVGSFRSSAPNLTAPSPAAGGQPGRNSFGPEPNQQNDTVWVNEVLAEKHEEVFIKLWDRLRVREDSFSALEQFPFGELLLGSEGEKRIVDHKIIITCTRSPVHHLNLQSWRKLLGKLKEQGYQLEQSEWRHPEFTVGTNGTTTSLIAVTLHVLKVQSGAQERFIVRGNLRVQWRKNLPADQNPFPEVIDATGLEFLSREGDTPFDHVIAADITPGDPKVKFQEPDLELYDLDGDGLSEIILTRNNRVFWNQGKGVFRPEPLCQHPLANVHTEIFADFDGDGLVDLLCVDSEGLMLFSGDDQGRFPNPGRRIRFTDRELPNPSVITAGDIDGDGDLDLWLAQYKVPYQGGQMPTPYYDANDGYPSFLLLNHGKGNFQDHTEAAGLASKRFRRAYSASFVDLDNDGDLDLLVVSDFAGMDLYYNDGRGHFTDVTSPLVDESHGFGMAHTFGDYDLDGQLDFFVIGMNSFVADRLDQLKAGPPQFASYNQMRSKMAYGNRMYFRRNGRFEQTSLSDQVARTGWSWGATSGDFDNDGDEDIYVVNGHISGRSAKDYETHFWRHDIYAATSKEDPVKETYFRLTGSKHYGAGHSYGGFEKKRFFLNESGRSFLEAGYLMGVALEEDCRNVMADDLDGDGKLDLLVITFEVWPGVRQQLRLFPNFMPEVGNWIGIRLRESGPGFSPLGAKIHLTTARGEQIRQLVTGDSYRSQHANTAHFGIGNETEVKSVEVVWPSGQKKSLVHTEINRYHLVMPVKE